MGDADNTLPSLKKRTAERQITKENLGLDDDEDTSGQDTGTFKRASDDVLAQRRIVKVRRASVAPVASNPFAGIRLVPPTDLSAAPVAVTSADQSVKSVSDDVGEKIGLNQETEKIKDESGKKSESKVGVEGTELTDEDERTKAEGNVEDDKKVQSSAGELGTESTVEDERTETEGNIDDDKKMQTSVSEQETEPMVSKGKDNTLTLTKPESTDGKKEEVEESKNDDATNNRSKIEETNSCKGADVRKDAASPFSSFQQLSSSQNAFTGVAGSGFSSSTFSFGPISKDGSSGFGKSALFSGLGSSITNRGENNGFRQEITVETGEENEKAIFTADSVLFEFLDGGWKERGKGEIKVNVSSVGTGKARLVMRAKGNYRLILNASLYPGMKLTAMEKKGVTFAFMNSNGEGKDELSTFALKFKDASIVEEFREAVTEQTCQTTTGLKTPKSSP